ncbi:hypothetical protein KSC_035240 [Ktedonobacter sp. SOSP1-52]|uniref:hypothetical protein n=1 Tax=Ktedonobacter sp. SOSP1-52 TaxID=2778366 RepID=UPI001916194C|nr:hypothetical protein [Ktedonobacter sp. SOSP1-52]GHO64632.1 hypothetical protein KSC_035240 [Ktedonobacter sp. SOSP1-52]
MNNITGESMIILTSSQSVPAIPSWFGEVTLITAYLLKLGILTKIGEQMRFARRRFGCYEVIDFVAVLFGYAIRLPRGSSGARGFPLSRCGGDPSGGQDQKPGRQNAGRVVYELFFTRLPQEAFTASDVVELYLHREAFEPTLADEDEELDPDRWCSHSPCGQECWQIASQWIWNLRMELGHQLSPTLMRTTEFAPAADQNPQPQGYRPPVIGGAWKARRFAGEAFALQPNGTVRCPAGKLLLPCERRREQGGSLRIVYAACIGDCRPCPQTYGIIR